MNIEHTLNLYCDLMFEIKVRTDAALAAINGKFPTHPLIAYETAYLQLRMICELIALSCLAVHGDIIPDSEGHIRKSYSAQKIMAVLSKIHPKFYPQPGKKMPAMPGEIPEVVNIQDGYLTKKELSSLWNACGNRLHRGELATLKLKLNDPKPFEPINMYLEKIITLLNHHQIAIHNSNDQIWCIMHGADDGKPHAFFMQHVGPYPNKTLRI